MPLINHIPAALKSLRLKAGLSQRAAAAQVRERTGACLTQAMLSQWERGDQKPSLESLGYLLEGLGFNLRDLDRVLGVAPREGQDTPPAEEGLIEEIRSRLRAEPQFGSVLYAALRSAQVTDSTPTPDSRLADVERALEAKIQALEDRLDRFTNG